MSNQHPRPRRVRPGVHFGEPVARIELTNGRWAVVDWDEWPRIVKEYGDRWFANSNGRGRFYARRGIKAEDGTDGRLTLARAVMQAEPGDRVEAINGDCLDCRRSNLRVRRGKDAEQSRTRMLEWLNVLRLRS